MGRFLNGRFELAQGVLMSKVSMKNIRKHGNDMPANLVKQIAPASVMMAAIMGCLFACPSTQAAPISAASIATLDTGAGEFGDAAGTTDSNWKVSLLSYTAAGAMNGNPAESFPPGYSTTPTLNSPVAAYLVPNSGAETGGQVPDTVTPWVPNTTTSSWLTYANPSGFPGGNINTPDNTGDKFLYALTFTAGFNGTVTINYVTDNESTLSVNSTQIGSTGSGSFGVLSPGFTFSVSSGSVYTVDVTVTNDIPNSGPNPTGADVQFTDTAITSVPDGGWTVALLGVSLAGVEFIRRKMAPRNGMTA
jgi:hypothetical protein